MLRLLKRLYKILTRREKILAAIVVTLFSVTSLMEVAGLGLVFVYVKLIMDPTQIALLPHVDALRAMLGLDTDRKFLTALGVFLLAVMLSKSALGVANIWASSRFSLGRLASFSEDLYAIYLYRDYLSFLKVNPSVLKQNILDETYQTIFNVMIPVFIIISELITLSAIILMLFILYPVQTFVMALTVALMFGSFLLFTRKFLDHIGNIRSQSNATRHQLVNDAFSTIKEMIVWNARGVFTGRFSKAVREFSYASSWNSVLYQMPRMLIEVTGFIVIIGMMIYYLQTSKNPAEVVSVIALYGAAGMRMMPSFSRITVNITQVRFSKRAFYSISEDLLLRRAKKKLLPQGVAEESPLPFTRKIEIGNVSFRYDPDAEKVLKDISLIIHKHSSVAFVGSSGAGKSTLMDMLLGVFMPDAGEIRIDETPLSDENIRNWRAHIGYVPQRVTLLDDTVAANIAFGVPPENVDMEQVRWAAKVAQIDQFIEADLPQQYETRLGERGIRLSGGQAQRIAIARALYRRPSVLVMDEATAALDNITEREITETLNELAGKITIIMIAHRLSTVKHCDMIYLFEKGRISDWGTYNALLERNETFQKMAG